VAIKNEDIYVGAVYVSLDGVKSWLDLILKLIKMKIDDCYIIKGVRKLLVNGREIRESNEIPRVNLDSITAVCVLDELGMRFLFKWVVLSLLLCRERTKDGRRRTIMDRRRTRHRRKTMGRRRRRNSRDGNRTIRNTRIIGDKRTIRCGIFLFIFFFFKFLCKEIIIPEGFEIENGILGLNRGVYLSLVRFLDSLILRKV
jgi:tmRNA-binding protein